MSTFFLKPREGDIAIASTNTVGVKRNQDPAETIHEGNSLHIREGTLAFVVEVIPPEAPDAPTTLWILIKEQTVEVLQDHFRVAHRAS